MMMKRYRLAGRLLTFGCRLVLWGALGCLSTKAEELLPAFPEAEGFGAFTPGGRGGQVLFVTTLEDYHPATDAPIPGSLRAVLTTSGPRLVLFRVSGTIFLKTILAVTRPHLTLAAKLRPATASASHVPYFESIHTMSSSGTYASDWETRQRPNPVRFKSDAAARMSSSIIAP